MSFNTTGAYTNVTGATGQVPGNVIPSAVWNNIHADIATALTQAMGQAISMQSTQNNLCFGNGGFEIWQRGAGAAASIAVTASQTIYTADRWYLATGANQASVVSAATALTANSGLAAKVLRNNGQTGTTAVIFGYPFDSESCVAMRGNKLALSFAVKAGANWSPASGTLTYNVFSGTGAPTKQSGGYAGQVTLLTGTINLTAGAAAQVVGPIYGTVTAGAAITQAEIQFTWTPVGTAGADDSVTIDDVNLQNQMSLGNTTPSAYTLMQFDRVPYSVALSDCTQHFQKTTPYGTAPAQNAGVFGALVDVCRTTTTRVGVLWRFVPSLRAQPTVTTFSSSGATANWSDITSGTSSAASVTCTSSNCIFVYSSTSLTASDLVYIHAQADAGI